MTDKLYNVLFVCTGNSARSIMAEGMLNKLGGGRFRAWSAGSHPKGAVHPGAIEVLERLGMSQADFRSKSWNEFAQPARRNCTSCSPCATTRPVRCARSGPVSR